MAITDNSNITAGKQCLAANINTVITAIRNKARTYENISSYQSFDGSANYNTGYGNATKYYFNVGPAIAFLEDLAELSIVDGMPLVTKGEPMKSSDLINILKSVISIAAVAHKYESNWYHKEGGSSALKETKTGIALFKNTAWTNKTEGSIVNSSSTIAKEKKVEGTYKPTVDISSFTGTPIVATDTVSMLTKLYNDWQENISNNKIVYTINSCHYNCHSNCHGSRGRR